MKTYNKRYKTYKIEKKKYEHIYLKWDAINLSDSI